jgi:hypothetical protein
LLFEPADERGVARPGKTRRRVTSELAQRIFGEAPALSPEPVPTSATSAAMPAPPKTVIEIRRLILPDGVDAQSVEALRRGGGDPDEKWTRKGRRQIYGAFFHSATPTANPARPSWQGEVGRPAHFIHIYQ